MDATSRSNETVWSERLASGPTFSLALSWGPGEALEGFWRDVFSTARPGSRVLEVGCGSGDVSIWAAEAGRGLKIVASDRFDAPTGVRTHADVTFLGGAPLEALPVPAGAFDMVVSNFALEYADRGPALVETARVLRPGGSAVLVLHSTDSALTRASRTIIEVDAALAAAGVPDKLHRAAGLHAGHLSRRKLLRDVLAVRTDLPKPDFGPTAYDYFEIAQRLLASDASARARLTEFSRGLKLRLEMAIQQTRAAMDEGDLRRFMAMAQSAGLSAETSELTYSYGPTATDKAGWLAFLKRSS